jgi:hypothetical protein
MKGGRKMKDKGCCVNNLLSALFLLTLLGGCASPIERPVLRDQIANVGTLSTVAGRRVVVVNTSFKQDAPYIESAFCAEPPPDISENLISNLTAKGDLSGKADTTGEIARIEAQAKLELAKSLQTSGIVLFRRTQGAQVMRDGSFSLCQSYINGAISKAQFVAMYEELMKKSVDLIKLELPLLYKQSGTTPGEGK